MVNLVVRDQRIPPVRGLVTLATRRGRRLSEIDARRWLRLNRLAYKTDKVDILAPHAASRVFLSLAELAGQMNCRVSLRTSCAEPPQGLGDVPAPGLLDVFLCPETLDGRYVDAWFEACRAANLPMRLQLTAPFNTDIEPMVERIASAGVASVNLSVADPFTARPACANAAASRETVSRMQGLARALAERGLEVNLVGLPFCQVDEALWPHVVTAPQFVQDHQQYEKRAYETAVRFYDRAPYVAGKIAAIYLAQYTAYRDPVDTLVLSLLLKQYRWAFVRILSVHKLTRHLHLLPFMPKAETEDTREHYEELRARRDKARTRELGPVCGRCALSGICGRATAALTQQLPGLELRPHSGERFVSPMHFGVRQPKAYDAIDADRLNVSEGHQALARAAMDVINNRPPDREVDSFDYRVDKYFCEQMPGGLRWFSVTNTEKFSTPLARLEPPFTLSVTFGGGIAEYIGFTFGRHAKIVCPMETLSHRLVLHVAEDGHYVLLRDGVPVQPVDFTGHYVPARLGGMLEPRISVWNIDNTLVTQTVLLWEGKKAAVERPVKPKYSVLYVCTRYTRRLEASLRCIAHQQGIDLNQIEVVIGYVPGLDPMDDIIDSFSVAYPDLRIIRSPFPEHYARSKGLMLNESSRLLSGEWTMILDADILLPPDAFARIEPHTNEHAFIAPDGRKMLSKETTARILAGTLEPWQDWQALLKTPGEFRLREAWGVPIGFCQVFRTECWEQVKYGEYDHFEGADWYFSVQLREAFGKEKRLTDVAVAHLDHGGSQWYGTQRHF